MSVLTWFDIIAVGILGITGAVKAADLEYDWIGILTLAFVAGCGGGLLRDILLNLPPALLINEVYIIAIMVSVPLGFLCYRFIQRIWILFDIVDVIGLALYATVGSQKALQQGFSLSAATLIGVINAVGGGMLRDILVRQEPVIFKPGQWYASIALLDSLIFGILVKHGSMSVRDAVILVVVLTLILRIIVVRLNLRTYPLRPRGYVKKKA